MSNERIVADGTQECQSAGTGPNSFPPHSLKYTAKQYESVPNSLKRLSSWVCWKYEPDSTGKPTKVPYNARTGGKASTKNRKTWATFAQALRASQRGGYDGLGIVLADGLAGTDLDHCRDAATGEIASWALGLIARHGGGYVEVSPSHTGVHILYALPVAAERGNQTPYADGNVEMYSYSNGGRLDRKSVV